MTMTDPSLIMLSERLAQGPMAAAEAQQFAGALAEALRRLHDQGSVVGALAPSRIMLSGSSVKLVVGEPSTCITPYTSPEQLQGHAPDARSDIFAYGAIVHEMVSGRKAFEGATADELRTAILEREPTPLAAEHAEFAKITVKCLAKAPLQRWQRMQRVQMELKLLTVVARRAAQEPAAKTADRMQAMVNSQIAEMEGRLAARIEAQDTKLQAAARIEQELRAEIAALEARLGVRLDAHDGRGAGLEKLAAEHAVRLAASGEAASITLARLGETEHALRTEIATLEARLAASGEAAHATSAKLGETEQALRAEVAALEARLAARADVHEKRGTELEKQAAEHDSRLASAGQTLRTHGSSIESLESAIAQTDDLVERVVEALDSLERSFAEQHEIKAVAARN